MSNWVTVKNYRRAMKIHALTEVMTQNIWLTHCTPKPNILCESYDVINKQI